MNNIEFNKVTWYSKLAAVILFIFVIPWWTFYLGMQFQEIKDLNHVAQNNSEIKVSPLQKTTQVVTDIPYEFYPFGSVQTYTINPNASYKNQIEYSFKIAVDGLSIYNNQTLIQVIPLTDDYKDKNGYNNMPFSLDDINFDGYKDLQIIDGVGASGNVSSSYWLFDVKTGKFIEDSVLSGISNVSFDKSKKEIHSDSRCCAGRSYSSDVYSFIGGKYILTDSFSHDYDTTDDNYAIETEQKLINGKMTEVSRKRVKSDLQN